MSFIGNIIWLVCGGLIGAVSWALAGILWTITIVGIPWAAQCFKFARLTLHPFGREVQYGGGAVSLLANIIWLLLSGIPLALEFFAFGCILCITIVGAPFGLQMFKLAKLALMPFGAKVERK